MTFNFTVQLDLSEQALELLKNLQTDIVSYKDIEYPTLEDYLKWGCDTDTKDRYFKRNYKISINFAKELLKFHLVNEIDEFDKISYQITYLGKLILNDIYERTSV